MTTETQQVLALKPVEIDIDLLAACKHGRCDEKGNVYLRTATGEQLVGSWALSQSDGDPIAFFARRYLDIVTEVELTRARLREANITPPAAQTVLLRIRKSCEAPNFVGDLETLQTRLASLESEVAQIGAEYQARKAEQKQEVLLKREALAARAEGLAESKKWKESQIEFTSLIEEWKKLPRVSKGPETKLWKRISAARSTFERRRRTHFAERKKQSAEAQLAKRELIKQAEQLANSTEWEKSSKALSSLMQKWKQAPRADRKSEEKLWQQFSTARDTFFGAKKAAEAKAEEAARANLPAAEDLVQKIEKVRQLSDLGAARNTLRPLLDAYDKVGALPKPDERSLNRRVKEVQDELRAKEEAARKRIDPEKSNRANSAAYQLKQRMDSTREELAQAEGRGDHAKATNLRNQLESQQLLLDAAEAVVKEFAS